MRRSKELPPRCPKPTQELLQLLTRPWTMHVLWVLSNSGPTRFGALRRQIDGISSRLLTERLRDLEEKGFIYRHYEPTIPPAVTYGLTERMQEISGALEKLDALAHKWQEEDTKAVRTKSEGTTRSTRTKPRMPRITRME
jgi:DNA-binding HxlR family transcriptional regulator